MRVRVRVCVYIKMMPRHRYYTLHDTMHSGTLPLKQSRCAHTGGRHFSQSVWTYVVIRWPLTPYISWPWLDVSEWSLTPYILLLNYYLMSRNDLWHPPYYFLVSRNDFWHPTYYYSMSRNDLWHPTYHSSMCRHDLWHPTYYSSISRNDLWHPIPLTTYLPYRRPA